MPLNAYIVKHIFKIKVEGIYSFILNPAVHTTAFVLEYLNTSGYGTKFSTLRHKTRGDGMYQFSKHLSSYKNNNFKII